MNLKYFTFIIIGLFVSIHLQSQNISIEVQNDTAYVDFENAIAHAYATIKNITEDTLTIDVIRDNYQGLPGWINAMCLDDLCYFASVDSVRTEIAPGNEIQFRSGFNLLNGSGPRTSEAIYKFKEIISNETIILRTYGVNTTISTSISESFELHECNIFPNPATQNISIDFDKQIEDVKIVDSKGRMVYQEKTGNKVLNVSQLNPGFYIVIIKANDGVLRKTLIKN